MLAEQQAAGGQTGSRAGVSDSRTGLARDIDALCGLPAWGHVNDPRRGRGPAEFRETTSRSVFDWPTADLQRFEAVDPFGGRPWFSFTGVSRVRLRSARGFRTRGGVGGEAGVPLSRWPSPKLSQKIA